VCFGFIVVVFAADPYIEMPENAMTSTMSTQLFCTLLCGMILLQSQEGDDDSYIPAILLTLFIVTIIGAVVMMILTVMDSGGLYAIFGPLTLGYKYLMKKKNLTKSQKELAEKKLGSRVTPE
jgi:hypothetical protein